MGIHRGGSHGGMSPRLLVVVLTLAVVLVGCGSGTTTGTPPKTGTPSAEAIGATKSPKPKSSSGDGVFGKGTYLVGTDLPAGTYAGLVTGHSPMWQVQKGATSLNVAWPTGPFNLTVKDGQYLTLDDVTIARSTTVFGPKSKYFTDGTYLVGRDIPAEMYQGVVGHGGGYFKEWRGSETLVVGKPTGRFNVLAVKGWHLTIRNTRITRARIGW